jgi:hypothetical protein
MSATTDRCVAFLTALSQTDVAQMPPAERQRLADQLQRVQGLVAAETMPPRPSGVLSDLVTRNGDDR